MNEMREFHDIIYRALFNMDTRALLIYFELSAACYEDQDDDDLCDCMGQTALEALGEVHHAMALWMELNFVPTGITREAMKVGMRDFIGVYAAKWKGIAQEQGIDLLTGEKRLK